MTATSVEDLLRSNCSPGGGKRFPDDIYKEAWIARVRARSIFDANGCWIWQGFIHGNGYGSTSLRGKTGRLHRQSFEVFKGPIPAGHDVCHTCDVRPCWNPEHMFSGTRQKNHDDMWAKGRAWQQKDACRHGHPWSEWAYFVPAHGNRKTGKQWRHCRLCDRIRHRTDSGWPRDLAESVPPLKAGSTWQDYVRLGPAVVRNTTDEVVSK